MARKEITVTIIDRERDLTFKIREMPATKLERWIIRALLLLAGGKTSVPEGMDAQKAAAYLSRQGLSALGGIDYDKAAPLLDELLACCSRVDAGIEQQLTPDIADGIIEDVRTLFRLRKEALTLNMGFFGVVPSGSGNGATPQPDLPNTSTCRP